MKYCASRRATIDLPTPPFSPPIRWILDCVRVSSVRGVVMGRSRAPGAVSGVRAVLCTSWAAAGLPCPIKAGLDRRSGAAQRGAPQQAPGQWPQPDQQHQRTQRTGDRPLEEGPELAVGLDQAAEEMLLQH